MKALQWQSTTKNAPSLREKRLITHAAISRSNGPSNFPINGNGSTIIISKDDPLRGTHSSDINAADIMCEMGFVKPKNKNNFFIKYKQGSTFEWANMATWDIPIGHTLSVLKNSPVITSPKTAHMGGVWHKAVSCKAGVKTSNKVVFQEKYGYPLILDNNQTPEQTLSRGDSLFWPGSIVRGEEIIDLPLYTWDGKTFAIRERMTPLFVPFIMTKIAGEFTPLSQVHRMDMAKNGYYKFSYLSDVLLASELKIREVCVRLLTRIENDFPQEPKQADELLQLVTDRSVSREGFVERDFRLRFVNGKFTMGEKVYKDLHEVTDHILMPYKIAQTPTLLLTMQSLPNCMPIFSNVFMHVLLAIINSHLKNTSASLTPVNTHFHWGGIQMVGSPPKFKGHFAVNTARRMRKLMQALCDDSSLNSLHEEEFMTPVYFVLLPALQFALWPNAAYPQDLEAVNILIAEIHAKSDTHKFKQQVLFATIAQVVENWYESNGSRLSNNFISRFSKQVSPQMELAQDTEMEVKPEGFDTLTFRQASILLGVLRSIIV